MNARAADGLEWARLGVTLQPMAEADLMEVAAIEADRHFHPWSLQNFADALTAGDRAWVCRAPLGDMAGELAGELAGYWLMRQVLDEAELLDITVAASWQGQGLGRALMAHLLDLARQSGVAKVFLEVRRSNDAARALYRRFAFVECGVRKAYYAGPDGREDAILMAVAL